MGSSDNDSDFRPPRPRDVIDELESLLAQSGHIAAVDEEYYRRFLALTDSEIEQLTVALLFSNRKAVRRTLAKKNPAAPQQIKNLVGDMLGAMSIGLLRFDEFGRLGFFSRIGPDPWEAGVADALQEKCTATVPLVSRTVDRSLAWIDSVSGIQTEFDFKGQNPRS